jgi:hypothetical protein
MELLIPRRTRPLAEFLRDSRGVLTDRALAQRLVRRLESEALARPGARLKAVCAPSVARAAAAFGGALADRYGARFTFEADAACPRERLEVSEA